MVNTYNPQKTEGKPYTCKEGIKNKDDLYSIKNDDRKITINKGDRHPTSIIEHENVYVFSDADDDLENKKNKELRSYAEKVKKYIGKSLKIIDKKIGNQGIHHFYSFTSTQFGIPIEKNYNKLIETYKINEMEGFIDYKTLKSKWDDEMVNTYNPQKTKGKPYKNGADKNPNNVYGITKEKGTITKTDRHPTSIIEHENIYVFKDKGGTYNPQKTEGKPYKAFETKKGKEIGEVYGVVSKHNENKGDKHPTSIYPDTIETTILEHNNPHKSLHRTQKPVALCEWLIKTYSNEGDTIMDFTMGSGTTGEACINTKRKFIGVEMDEEIFEAAEERLKKKVVELKWGWQKENKQKG